MVNPLDPIEAKQVDSSDVAAKSGRIACLFYGIVLLLFGSLAAYFNAENNAVLASTLIVVGTLIVVLGFLLPRKMVVVLAFLLPW